MSAGKFLCLSMAFILSVAFYGKAEHDLMKEAKANQELTHFVKYQHTKK